MNEKYNAIYELVQLLFLVEMAIIYPLHSCLQRCSLGHLRGECMCIFFFHETGTEFKGCMQKTVSRVARVCKVRKFKIFTI